ncbi:MAG TPA: hypothetical protein VEG34_19100 [Thermoanaerobaculia bacterium]|nr:hypothetical protein [Thermoanaerobaculia bacterium]
MIVDPNEIQRLRFQEGQDLLSRDFQDGALFEARLREWHNRALHEVHGVRFGLRAWPVPNIGNPTAAAVSAGLAYEATGRALFLPAPTLVPVPSPWPGGPHLLVLRPGPPPNGGDELAWLPEALWRPCTGVPLARLDEDDGEPVWDREYRPAMARPLAQPRIGYGATLLGGTAWEILDFGQDFRTFLVGCEVEVDTRTAGFTRTPCYFASLQGQVPLPLFTSIEQAAPAGFRLRVLTIFPLRHDLARQILRAFLRKGLALSWLGLQD